MKVWSCLRRLILVLMIPAVLCIWTGCDGGKEAVDEATGNRAVKQYLKAKDDVERIAGRQIEKYNSALTGGEREEE